MNAPLRRAGVVILVLFALLFANLNWIQGYKADDYRTSKYNGRVQYSEYERQRGSISTGRNGVVVAQSVETQDDLKYLRKYPMGPQYAHLIGYKPVNLGATDIEQMENDYLSGNADSQFVGRLAAMFTGKRVVGGNIRLTILPKTQETAYDDLVHNNLGVKKGAVVALNPDTGALLSAVSIPSYDPNPLVSHDTDVAQAAYDKLSADKSRPLANRAFSETYPAGSTFKVIDSAAALSSGIKKDDVIPGGTQYQPPQTTHPITNAPGVVCPDQITLKDALRVSCNTAFSRLCVEQLHAEKIKSMAKGFGFEATPKFDQDEDNDLGVVPSHTGDIAGPNGQEDPAALAISCIGQLDVRMTPLQGALIAATVANGGSQMRPYLIDSLQTADLTPTYQADPKEARQPISGSVAGDLREMMIGVVQNGTGRRAQISGFDVGGKTGTAENGEQTEDHGWFIGFAMKNGKPIVAVAVFLEGAGKGGSAEAARIAGEVMKAAITEQGIK